MVARPSNPDVAVELVDVTAGYTPGRPVLSGLSLLLDSPGIVHLTGGNGAGKSTLIEVMAGYLPLVFGQARVAGHDVRSPRAREHRRICRTKVALFPELAAGDHLALACRLSGVPVAEALRRAERYGLTPWLDTAAKALSTGNQRKLWIVMCTTGHARLVVLDEPLLGLDTTGQEILLEELQATAARATVLLVAHDLPAGLDVDDRIHLTGASECAA